MILTPDTVFVVVDGNSTVGQLGTRFANAAESIRRSTPIVDDSGAPVDTANATFFVQEGPNWVPLENERTKLSGVLTQDASVLRVSFGGATPAPISVFVE